VVVAGGLSLRPEISWNTTEAVVETTGETRRLQNHLSLNLGLRPYGLTIGWSISRLWRFTWACRVLRLSRDARATHRDSLNLLDLHLQNRAHERGLTAGDENKAGRQSGIAFQAMCGHSPARRRCHTKAALNLFEPVEPELAD
jgi:hypothetical protein